MPTDRQVERTSTGVDDIEHPARADGRDPCVTAGDELFTTAGHVRTAWRAGDLLAARRWCVCLTLLLLEHAEASGFPIWNRRTAVTTPRRAGCDVWNLAWRIIRGEPETPSLRVDDLLPLVALFLADTTPAAAGRAVAA
jgi:hypothetical protein